VRNVNARNASPSPNACTGMSISGAHLAKGKQQLRYGLPFETASERTNT
jgi:hypothetical protein